MQTIAQNAPRGMKYQAVARDLKGEILANATIELKINLLSQKGNSQTSHYSEIHTVVTNQIGLFTLVVGAGKSESGDFEKVPWSSDDIWMEIQIKANGQSDFTAISNSQLLAVPYAYYAATAGVLAGKILKEDNGQPATTARGTDPAKCPCEGGLSQIKLLYLGNDGVTVKVWGKKDQKDLLATFTGVNNGATLTVNANNYPDGKFKNETFFEVVASGAPIQEISTECEELKEPWEMSLGETFGNFSVLSHRDRKNNAECTVCDVRKEWHVGGNGLMDMCNLLGTKSYTDLVLITKNIERLRITKDGDINIASSLQAGNNLTVKNNVYLNTTGGGTVNNGPLTVANMSPTYLTGSLTVDKLTKLNDATESTSPTTGALVVTGGVGIGKKLNVGGMEKIWDSTESTSPTTGALVVTGGAGIGKNLNVGGASAIAGNTTIGGSLTVNGATVFSNQLNVTQDVPDGQYVASFTNTNNGNGDGIKIKLGKAKSIFVAPAIPELISASSQEQLKNLIRCDYPVADKITLLGNLALEATLDDIKAIGGIAVGAGNYLISFINSNVGLPFNISSPVNNALHLPYDFTTPINTNLSLPLSISAPINTALHLPNNIGKNISDGLGLPYKILGETIIPAIDGPTIPAIPSFAIPPLPSISIPAMPNLSLPPIPVIDLTGIGVPAINISDLSFWGIPDNLCLTDANPSPLNNANEFIRFTDKNDAKMGAIKAESVSNWATNYLFSPSYLFKLRGALTSSTVDKFHAKYHFKNEISTAIKAFTKLGVEYSSGNGDYAEWLQRVDTKELITPGDIVAVKGGKITKDLQGAEQVMVVSHSPIVLGNLPSENSNLQFQGNSIAFMGQVPVKIIGPVSTGDFIIGQTSTPGYGVAKHPNDMTIQDFKLAVGRSWEDDKSDEPKMVNTLVGIVNGDYLKILKGFENKFEDAESKLKETESRLKKLEEKVDQLLNKAKK